MFELALGRTQLLVYKADVFRWHGQKPASYMYVISCSPNGFICNFSNRWKIFSWNLSSSKTFRVKPSLIRRTPSGKLLGALLIQTCVIWFLVEPICKKKIESFLPTIYPLSRVAPGTKILTLANLFSAYYPHPLGNFLVPFVRQKRVDHFLIVEETKWIRFFFLTKLYFSMKNLFKRE